jgi:voltage-gated potassium channel
MTGTGNTNTPPDSVARKAGRAAHPQNLVERRLTKFLHAPPSVRLAANVIVTATLLIVVVGGVLMRVLDHKEYASVWLGMWWVLETVTTVGYGDLTPESAIGKILTSLVMLWGVAFLAIITAAITSVFVARAQRERKTDAEHAAAAERTVGDRLDQIDAQLQQLRELLERTPPAP